MKQTRTNPFYVLLLVAGVAFCVTACAYGTMAIRADHQARSLEGVAAAPSGLLNFLEEHGGMLMVGELALLGIATVAAMATDGYLTRRATAKPTRSPEGGES